ncbi:MAG: hypothetical protein KatS3mg115_0696 [Candidatus Poribacteria bacterium]|nr:MAG: hypothetical protein KatS3mg115_0696 [Candidatus Poribacteria bacterium]
MGRFWSTLTQGERLVLGALLVLTLLGVGVEAAKRWRPEWFYGPPDFLAQPNPPVPQPRSPEPLENVAHSSEIRDEGTSQRGAPPERVEDRLDLNAATVQELEALPGIGPTLARRIVEYREQFGPFQSVEELVRVRGIGAKRLEALRGRVTVASPTQDASRPQERAEAGLQTESR